MKFILEPSAAPRQSFRACVPDLVQRLDKSAVAYIEKRLEEVAIDAAEIERPYAGFHQQSELFAGLLYIVELEFNRLSDWQNQFRGFSDKYLSESTAEGKRQAIQGFLSALAKHPLATRAEQHGLGPCLLYTSPSPRDLSTSRMPSSA